MEQKVIQMLRDVETYRAPVWIQTDDSSFQHVRACGTQMFDLIEMGAASPVEDRYEVYRDTIALSDYLTTEPGYPGRDELTEILNTFGYPSIENVQAEYGRYADQIMAECVFEHYGSNQAETVYEGTEEECRTYILSTVCTDNASAAIKSARKPVVRLEYTIATASGNITHTAEIQESFGSLVPAAYLAEAMVNSGVAVEAEVFFELGKSPIFTASSLKK